LGCCSPRRAGAAAPCAASALDAGRVSAETTLHRLVDLAANDGALQDFDDEVAAVVTYVRVAWDNSGTPVQPSQANELRKLLPE